MGELTRTLRQAGSLADRHSLQRRIERLDYLPQVERVYVCNGEQPPTDATDFEVGALCALLGRVSTRLLQEDATRRTRLKVVK